MNLRTPVATKLIGAVALLLIAALGWVLLVGPALGAIGEADEARADSVDSSALLTTQLADLREQAEDLPRTAQSAAELEAIFPATADQPGFFAGVTEAALGAGIDASAIDALSPSVPTIISTDPAATDPAATTDPAADPSTDPSAETATVPTDPSALAVQTVSMSVSGTYPQLTQLLANLETMSRALLVSGVSLTRDETGQITMTLEGATFVAPPLVEPEAVGGEE